MKRQLTGLVFLLLLLACKGKKASLQGEDEVSISDFIDFYPAVSLPYRIADTSLPKAPGDSMEISYKIFKQFVPDSTLTKDLGKSVVPRFFALGKTTEKGKETYLFTEVIAGGKRMAYLTCFSKDQKFLNAMVLVRTGDDNSSAFGMLDNKYQVTTYKEKKKGSGDFTYKRNVYFYNSNANTFTLIFTEPNTDIIENIINPIDSMPAKGKFAGDYMKDKKNFISVRDGRNAAEIMFFIHFETEDNCTGELKGTAKFVSPTTARYKEPNNPCALELSFVNNRASMKETGGCGGYRDIKCFFEGSFPKKAKRPVSTKAKK
jgi:hypothetical protein